jgi:hypothetical protein
MSDNFDYSNIQKNLTEAIANATARQKKELQEINALYKDIGSSNESIQKKIQDQILGTQILNDTERDVIKSLSEANTKMILLRASSPQDADTMRDMIKGMEDQLSDIAKSKKLLAESYSAEKEALLFARSQREYILNILKTASGIEFKEISTLKSHLTTMTKMFPDLSANIIKYAAGITTMFIIASEILKTFEKSAFEFRKYSGMFLTEAVDIRKMSERIAIDFARIGINVDGVIASVKALGSYMGGLHNVTKELAITTSLLSSQFGVSEENTSGMLKNLASISQSTMQSQQYMALYAQGLSAAAGVPLNLVMGDIAKLSGVTLSLLSRSPAQIVKMAVEARKLGSELNRIVEANSKLLDFNTSIADQMEASVLIGKSISFDLARRLTYQGDSIRATEEILRLTREVNFEQLDFYAKQSFAKASGRSVDELMSMLTTQRQLNEARSSGSPEILKQLAAYERLKLANDETAKKIGQNLELIYKQKANQEMLVQLQNNWNQLLMQASEILLPIVSGGLKMVGFFMNLAPMVLGLWKALSLSAGALSLMGVGVSNIASAGTMAIGIFSKISQFLPFITKFSLLAKTIGWAFGFGEIIFALQILSSIWKHFTDDSLSFPEKIKNVLYDALIAPFKQALSWLGVHFLGNSPSQIGLRIVTGIVSVQDMIFDALKYPFQKAWDWIGSLPGMSLFKGDYEQQMPIAITSGQKNPDTISDHDKSSSRSEDAKKKEPEFNKQVFIDILNAVNNLNANLESGKIGVYIDGQLMSATLARQTAFKGGFGMNVA